MLKCTCRPFTLLGVGFHIIQAFLTVLAGFLLLWIPRYAGMLSVLVLVDLLLFLELVNFHVIQAF